MTERINYLKERIEEIKETIQYNRDEIKKGNRVAFHWKWNNELQFEIDAIELAIANYKSTSDAA